MAATLQADYGNRLLGSDCLDPRTRDLKFGTNLYYSDYCANLLQLNTIRHTSSATPYFESLLYNQGIIFKSAQYPNLSAEVFTDGNEIEIFTKSNNPYFYSLLQTTNQASSLTIAGPSKAIELNTSHLINNLGIVKMKDIGLDGANFYILTNGERGSRLDITARRAVSSQYSEQALRAGEADFANTAAYAFVAGEASYSLEARNSFTSKLSEKAVFSYAAEVAQNATTAAYALQSAGGGGPGGSAFAAFATQAGFAGTATDAQFAANASFATKAGQAGYAGTATNAQFAANASFATQAGFVSQAGFAGTATDAQFAANASFATQAGFVSQAGFAGTATDAQFAANASFATKAGQAGYAGTATNAQFAANASFATQAGFVSQAGFAGTATDAQFAANASFATKAGQAGYAGTATNAQFAANASFATQAGLPNNYSELAISLCINGSNTTKTFLVR